MEGTDARRRDGNTIEVDCGVDGVDASTEGENVAVVGGDGDDPEWTAGAHAGMVTGFLCPENASIQRAARQRFLALTASTCGVAIACHLPGSLYLCPFFLASFLA